MAIAQSTPAVLPFAALALHDEQIHLWPGDWHVPFWFGAGSVCMQGLGRMEMDNLRDWEAKFNFKYPIVGSLVKG